MLISKTKLALALMAMTLVIPATAFATHAFDDVPDGEYYSEAIEWASANGITHGTGGGNFSPTANVTRRDNVTFAWRYDKLVAQPKFDLLDADIAALEASPGAIVGMIRVQADGTITKSWMANGNTPTLSKAGTGDYRITWPDISININVRPALLTKINAGEIAASSVSGNLIVKTYTSAGAAADSQFWAFITNAP